MDTNNNYKILKYSPNYPEINGLCNFDFDENCLACNCDVFVLYLEFYKQLFTNKVSNYIQHKY